VSLQKRLVKIKGVAVSCFHPAPSSKSNAPARSERGGSVTGSN
jgi:hypothetical protein